MNNLHQTLQQYFGYSTFRPLQKEIIQDVMSQKDVFVLMPTGGGKSLCYQLPSLMQNHVTIVISPLISLMKDQVDGLRQNGIRAAYLNSSLLLNQQNEVLKHLQNNQLSLLYVAPERLVQNNFLALLKQIPINFFAIDEAHCISQWGHDFRPEYRQLDLLRKNFPGKSLVALTATATPRVKTDIINRLCLKNPKMYQAGFNRPNLSYQIIAKQNPFEQIYRYIGHRPSEAGIVYCQSRKTVESVAERLRDHKINALPYHAGLPDEIRKQNQEKFIRDDIDIIVATIAFGMGIDKPDVRFVIHYDLPKSLEHYYQETGRAGRDGLPSECLFLYSYGDKFAQERFIQEKTSKEEQLIARMQLSRVIDYAQSKICRRALLLKYFAEQFKNTNCKNCDNCLVPKQTFDATIVTQKILSCIYRTNQRFGVGHIINILVGSKAESVLRYNHHLLSTYGIIDDYDRSQIKTFIYELIQQEYLKQSEDQYGILSLTNKSTIVLKGKEKVFLTKAPRLETAQQKAGVFEGNQELFNRLRALRKQIADEKNLPPYIIFSDASLKDMATYFPQSKEQFSKMYGVGTEKLKKYGQVFLNEIIAYCKPLNISPVQKLRNYSSSDRRESRSRFSTSLRSARTLTDTASITLELFQKGKSVSQIAKQRGFTEETIHKHLQDAYLRGEKIDINEFVSPAKQKEIQTVFDELGYDRLAPVKEKLGDTYSYAELRWIQTKLRKEE